MAFLVGALGLLSLGSSRRIEDRVTGLTSVSIARFERDRAVGRSLEIEVESRDGSWHAEEIEVLGGRRQPKLRGPVDRAAGEEGLLVMFGVPIRVDGQTEFDGGDLAGFVAGQRLEVSCAIEPDGTWRARKVRTTGLKASDKIKGVVTGVSMDGIPPDTFAISGIEILLDSPGHLPDAQVVLTRTSNGVRMTLLLQDCLRAARHALAGSREPVVALDGEFIDAATLMEESVEDLVETVAAARRDDRGGSGGGPEVVVSLWLDPLAEQLDDLEAMTREFLSLVDRAPADAEELFLTGVEPLIVDRMRPLAHAYLLDGEEKLSREVGQVTGQARATARNLLGASVLAILVALALGYGVFRSIAHPLRGLAEAADRIGKGDLATRVEPRSDDELGLLAATLNGMAEEIEANTVSISNLNDVLESMAGALFLLDAEGTVTAVNQAACALTGKRAADLEGSTLAQLCTGVPAAPLLPTPPGISRGEARLGHRDGTSVPVAFSGAARVGGVNEVRGFVWVAQDLSGRIAMEDELRRSLADKELLLREVHHRVKNNLQVISSLLELQADCIEDPAARAVYAESQARIRSMALIHQQLYGTTELDSIDFGAYLDQLAMSLLQFHGGGGPAVAIRADADRVRMGIDRAMTCGLIINELVTNALKHAFEPGRPGTVTLGFRSDAGRHVLIVTDDGSGLPDGYEGNGDSLGMSLIAALVEQLEGTLRVESGGGTRFIIEFPAEEAA